MHEAAVTAVRRARERGESIAIAESLTGGDLASVLIGVPGASDVVRGAVVAYAVDVKVTVLGVDEELLDGAGPVSEPVAIAMAGGVRRVMDGSIGVSTTGAAGPEPHGGQPPGTVWVAVESPAGARARRLDINGNRATIRAAAVEAALALLCEALDDPEPVAP